MAFDFKNIQDANHLACFWLLHGWQRSSHREQRRLQDLQPQGGHRWPRTHKETLPPLKIPEVTSQLSFAEACYLEQFSGGLNGTPLLERTYATLLILWEAATDMGIAQFIVAVSSKHIWWWSQETCKNGKLGQCFVCMCDSSRTAGSWEDSITPPL